MLPPFLSIETALTETCARRHVLNDLEPYVCLFEDCNDAHRLFRDRAAWLSHMQETHTKQWTCTAAGHKLCVFETEQDFEHHMRVDHAASFKESQLPWYKKRSQGPAASTFSACPLCGYEPAEEKLNTLTKAKGSDNKPKYEQSKRISEEIVKHLAAHLQAISMKALPWQENVEEELSEKGGSKQAEEGHESDDSRSSFLSADTNTSLNFDDNPQFVRTEWQYDDPGATGSGFALRLSATYESYKEECE